MLHPNCACEELWLWLIRFITLGGAISGGACSCFAPFFGEDEIHRWPRGLSPTFSPCQQPPSPSEGWDPAPELRLVLPTWSYVCHRPLCTAAQHEPPCPHGCTHQLLLSASGGPAFSQALPDAAWRSGGSAARLPPDLLLYLRSCSRCGTLPPPSTLHVWGSVLHLPIHAAFILLISVGEP